jgi:hypothetical protein
MSSAKLGGPTASGEMVPGPALVGGYPPVKLAEGGRVEWAEEGEETAPAG